MARKAKSIRRRGRTRVNNPPNYLVGRRRKGPKAHTGGPDSGRPTTKPKPEPDTPPDDRTEPKNTENPSKHWSQNEDGTWTYTADVKPEYDRWHHKTKDIKQKEDESDEDYKARQEKYRESRGRKSRQLLRKSYGPKWGKDIYEDTGTTAKERQKLRTKFQNVRGKEDDLIRKIQGTKGKQEKLGEIEEGDEEGTAKAEALAKRLEALQEKRGTVKDKRKEAGSNLKEIRQARQEGLQKAYEHPQDYVRAKGTASAAGKGDIKANKRYTPKGRPTGRGGPYIGNSIQQTGTGRGPTRPGGRPNIQTGQGSVKVPRPRRKP